MTKKFFAITGNGNYPLTCASRLRDLHLFQNAQYTTIKSTILPGFKAPQLTNKTRNVIKL